VYVEDNPINTAQNSLKCVVEVPCDGCVLQSGDGGSKNVHFADNFVAPANSQHPMEEGNQNLFELPPIEHSIWLCYGVLHIKEAFYTPLLLTGVGRDFWQL
jgi:hypothetical protein